MEGPSRGGGGARPTHMALLQGHEECVVICNTQYLLHIYEGNLNARLYLDLKGVASICTFNNDSISAENQFYSSRITFLSKGTTKSATGCSARRRPDASNLTPNSSSNFLSLHIEDLFWGCKIRHKWPLSHHCHILISKKADFAKSQRRLRCKHDV